MAKVTKKAIQGSRLMRTENNIRDLARNGFTLAEEIVAAYRLRIKDQKKISKMKAIIRISPT